MKLEGFLIRFIYWYLKNPLWLINWVILRLSGINVSLTARVSHKAKVHKMGGSITIHDNATINDHVKIIAYGGDITIGSHVSINYNSILYGHGGLHIGNNTRIAAHSMFIPMNHLFDDLNVLIKDQGISKKGIHVGNNVWVGAGVKVLDGVCVSDGAVIGAGTVVSKNLLSNGVYVGNPAKLVRYRGELGDD